MRYRVNALVGTAPLTTTLFALTLSASALAQAPPAPAPPPAGVPAKAPPPPAVLPPPPQPAGVPAQAPPRLVPQPAIAPPQQAVPAPPPALPGRPAMVPAVPPPVQPLPAQRVLIDALDLQARKQAEIMIVQQRLGAFGEGQFDQMIFTQDGNATAARKRMDLQLRNQIEELQRSCQLNDDQKKKLLLAGRGDIKRFFDRYEQLRQSSPVVQHGEGQQFVFVRQDVTPLQRSMQTGLFQEGSLFQKSIATTLTSEQLTRYEAELEERRLARHRTNVEMMVRLIERSVPLRDADRRELIKMLVAETTPARNTNPYGTYQILLQLDRIPEEKLRRYFTAAQWNQVNQSLAQYKAVAQQLRASGRMPDENGEENVRAVPGVILAK